MYLRIRVNKDKLVICQEERRYLGQIVSQEGRRLTGDRKHTVRNTPLPETKKALLSFIGLWSYCRTWIPRFANMEGTFRDLLTRDMKNTDKVQWTEKAREQFDKAKDCIMNSPALGWFEGDKPYELFVDTSDGYMRAVLTQTRGGLQKPVGYISKRIDCVARAYPNCVQSIVGMYEAVLAVRDWVRFAPLTVWCHHQIKMLLQDQHLTHLTTQRYLKYETCLFGDPTLTVKTCSKLNPTTILPFPSDDADTHDCQEVVRDPQT